MKQTRIMSFVESTINILVGFGISLGAQILFLPMLGVTISLGQNLTFALLMTAISIARSFLLRRLFEALHIRRPLSPFMQACIAERYRQVDIEGWDTKHDDDHDAGELARAGAAYAYSVTDWVHHDGSGHKSADELWPWDMRCWKPTGFRRDLVKAGALIIAEGEKFDRARKSKRST